MLCTKTQLDAKGRKLMAELITAIGMERFNDDCRLVRQWMVAGLEEWSVYRNTSRPVRPGRIDLGDVEWWDSLSVDGKSGGFVVEFWASQATCDKVGHLVHSIIFYVAVTVDGRTTYESRCHNDFGMDG